MPIGTASPKACVSLSRSAKVAPGSTHALRVFESTRTDFICDRSIMRPPSHTAFPAILWPPPRRDQQSVVAGECHSMSDVACIAAAHDETGPSIDHRVPDRPCLPVGWCILIEHLARGSPPGWFSAVKDRHVGVALRLIHGSPTQDWTLETLAREVGLSRSALAKRFHLYVGAPPSSILGAGACNWPRTSSIKGPTLPGRLPKWVTNRKPPSIACSSDSSGFRRVPGAAPGGGTH
jgi:AraC-like DNA-binding protein